MTPPKKKHQKISQITCFFTPSSNQKLPKPMQKGEQKNLGIIQNPFEKRPKGRQRHCFQHLHQARLLRHMQQMHPLVAFALVGPPAEQRSTGDADLEDHRGLGAPAFFVGFLFGRSECSLKFLDTSNLGKAKGGSFQKRRSL